MEELVFSRHEFFSSANDLFAERERSNEWELCSNDQTLQLNLQQSRIFLSGVRVAIKADILRLPSIPKGELYPKHTQVLYSSYFYKAGI